VLREHENQFFCLNELGPGDCFGEMSVIECRNRNASVRALSACVAIEIALSTLHALYERDIQQYLLACSKAWWPPAKTPATTGGTWPEGLPAANHLRPASSAFADAVRTQDNRPAGCPDRAPGLTGGYATQRCAARSAGGLKTTP
jgi:hypothetical protein